MREVGMIAKLLRAYFCQELHIVLAAEVQAARRARLDARGFEPFAHAVRAKRALEYAVGLRVHFWNVERASRYAISPADAVALLKINNAIRVLHDLAVRGPSPHASRL